MRIDEMEVIDIKFLDGCSEPSLALLYEDPKKDRHIKTYEIMLEKKVCSQGCLSHAIGCLCVSAFPKSPTVTPEKKMKRWKPLTHILEPDLQADIDRPSGRLRHKLWLLVV